LTKAQLQKIKAINNGEAIIKEKVNVTSKGTFSKRLHLKENDVLLITLSRI